MTKKTINVSIDEEILKKAKEHLPNISNFFEECLKHYLGYANGTMPVVSDLELLDKIGKLQTELFILNENYDAELSRKRVENFEKDKAWRFLWNDYRSRLRIDEILLKKAVELLELNEETLEDILDWVYVTDSEVDTNSWQEVWNSYKNNGE